MRETLPVLYRDDRVVAVHKPSGLLVHRSMIDRHETRFALQIVRDQIGQRVYPVHRLDKGTSGVLLFALDPESAKKLGAAFDTGKVAKRYLAIVRGWTPTSGVIDHPLRILDDGYGTQSGKSGVGPEFLQVTGLAEAAATCETRQAAVTHFHRLATAEMAVRVLPEQRFPTSRYSLVALNPLTGRQHQLRRHLKHIAHPIIGDATHGKGVHNRFFAETFGVNRLLLACCAMAFPHPDHGTLIEVKAELPPDFVQVMAGLGWSSNPPVEFWNS